MRSITGINFLLHLKYILYIALGFFGNALCTPTHKFCSIFLSIFFFLLKPILANWNAVTVKSGEFYKLFSITNVFGGKERRIPWTSMPRFGLDHVSEVLGPTNWIHRFHLQLHLLLISCTAGHWQSAIDWMLFFLVIWPLYRGLSWLCHGNPLEIHIS